MTPRASYRLQLHPGFGFAAAAEAVPYLAELGISHLYLSPVLQAAEGSTHGYDIVDSEAVSHELGGEAGFAALVAAAKASDLAILLDIVPNHMSIEGTRNRWWNDVLENGGASYFASYFDVDWTPAGKDRVLLPVLGERYGRALTSGTLAIHHEHGTFRVRAHDMRFPISPVSLGPIVRRAGERIAHAELQFIGESLSALPSSRERDAGPRHRRHRHKAVLLTRLEELIRAQPAAAEALDAELAAINRDPVELDTVLESQNYRLAYWTVADSQLSYRRFFDITTLVGIRNEDPDVLEASHRRIFGWLADGTIDGIRVDHVDGLRDPEAYLRQLRARAPDAWIVVEKILIGSEHLPTTWPIDGTTGYDFMDRLGQLFIDPDGEQPLTAAFTAYTGAPFDPHLESRRARLDVMTDALHSELARLTRLAVRACGASPACRDYTRTEIEVALAEVLAGYPVYRTYLGGEQRTIEDRARIAHATTAAIEARPDLDRDLLAFLEAALAFELPSPEAIELGFAAQQVTGPIVAKGDEDTLLYRQVRLVSRCDVGADLAAFAMDPPALHVELAAGRARSMLATSTHDTKRSEDVRARISVLSELPGVWTDAVEGFRTRAAAGWGNLEPDRTFEYLMWQTLVGAWPLPLARALPYAEKATREARLRTSWRRPDATYEAARTRWLENVYADNQLFRDIGDLSARLAPHGDRNSLAMLLIKLTAPGVPDLYQGSELRADSLVDPDNRRPVDLAARRRALADVRDATTEHMRGDLDRMKLHVIARVLGHRRRAPSAFDGAYRALGATGPHAHRVFAFARGDDLVTVVPRISASADGWRDTTLTVLPGSWRELLSERSIPAGDFSVAELWRDLPIALLVRA
ncbi:MAG: malto-oligosyltrehalose synthase [Deltaproteobacteria bacterium]|nr:malto-oligosyltrehalose synthase [Deltaproteobacteria bacterium]